MSGRAVKYRPSGLLGGIPLAWVITALCIALIVTCVLAIGVGAVALTPAEVLTALRRAVSGRPLDAEGFIVWELRAPRILEAVIAGAGLAVSGLVAQVLVRNPIADPHVLGVSSGAGAGAVLVLTTIGAGAGIGLQAAAFIGALAAGAIVAALASGPGGFGPLRLVLVGIAIGQLLSGAMSFLIIRADNADAAQSVVHWLLGSLAGAQWTQVLVGGSVLAVSMALLSASTGRLDVLALGDSAARGLGTRPDTSRALLFVIVAALTATIVSMTGTIGFVGLVVPNLARLLVGGVHRRLLPVTALLGALLIVGADTAARTIIAPAEVPIGILTAAIGVPLFVVLVRRGLRAGS